MPVRVLFVCLGNICRSPAAEAAFRRAAADAGLDAELEADSAGTGAWHVGERPDPRMQEAGRRRGLSVTSVARQIATEDFARFDYILAMDRTVFRTIQRLAPPAAREKIHLFRTFDPEGGDDVPDPYYGDTADFEDVLDIVTRTARALVAELRPASA